MRNDTTKDQPKCAFIHPRKGIHCTMHALQGSKYCIRHKHLEEAPWVCQKCGQSNASWATTCGRCEDLKPKEREYPSRIFDGFNQVGPPCPICKTKADHPTVLVAIEGTQEGNIVECRQVHRECFDLKMKMNGIV